jgi:hypothetical protein
LTRAIWRRERLGADDAVRHGAVGVDAESLRKDSGQRSILVGLDDLQHAVDKWRFHRRQRKSEASSTWRTRVADKGGGGVVVARFGLCFSR